MSDCPIAPALAAFNALVRVRGIEISVSRAGNMIVRCADAVIGRARFLTDDAAGARIEGTSHEFLIRACDYANGYGMPSTTVPMKGDRITRTTDCYPPQTYTYEVETPPYDFHDAAGLILRVHTVLASVQ